MRKSFLLALLASAYAEPTPVCSACHAIVHAIDTYDPVTIAVDICPSLFTGEFEQLCEYITPSIIDWMQTTGEIDMICNTLCSTGEDYDYSGDYNNLPHEARNHPFDLPHVDLHEAHKEGHHPFDLPHVDLHEAHKEGHHPFDLPHEEPVDIIEIDSADVHID